MRFVIVELFMWFVIVEFFHSVCDCRDFYVVFVIVELFMWFVIVEFFMGFVIVDLFMWFLIVDFSDAVCDRSCLCGL
jgi:hypothetical protein